MSVLLLRLAGPMQAWGDRSRYSHRGTRREPTKSGVAGMLAAARGMRRTDSLEDFARLRFGVRTDQVGQVHRDFQTTIDWRTGKSKPLTDRDYLVDARFLAVFEGERSFLETLAQAVIAPEFPMYLGRRACPPTGRILLGVEDKGLEEALRDTDWLAANWYRKRQPESVQLAVTRDLHESPAEARADEVINDQPISFDPRDRRHGLRRVVHEWVTVDNSELGRPAIDAHDPMALLGGD